MEICRLPLVRGSLGSLQRNELWCFRKSYPLGAVSLSSWSGWMWRGWHNVKSEENGGRPEKWDVIIYGKSFSGWWFLTYFWNFHPENWGRWTHFDSYFSKGLNHQLVFNVPDLRFLFVSRKAIMPSCLEDRRIVLDHQPLQSTLTHWVWPRLSVLTLNPRLVFVGKDQMHFGGSWQKRLGSTHCWWFRNPARKPPGMYTPWILGYLPYQLDQLVQDFFHQQ